jgi:hypothetical protein
VLQVARWGAYDKTVVHVLNYAIPRGDPMLAPTDITDLTVRVAIAPGSPAPTTAYWSAPVPGQESPKAVSLTATGDGRYQFQIPYHHVYSLVVLE